MNCVLSPYGVVSTTAAADAAEPVQGFRAIIGVSGRNPELVYSDVTAFPRLSAPIGPSSAQLPSKRKPNGYRCEACGAPATRMTVDGVPLCEGDFWHLVEHATDGDEP